MEEFPSLSEYLLIDIWMSLLEGKSHPCPALRSLSNKFGGMFCRKNTTNKYKQLDAKVEKKMIEARQGTPKDKNFRSMSSIILKFPHFKDQMQYIRAVFQQYDKDCNEIIDRQELEKCLQKLQFNLTNQDIDDLFNSCDIKGIGGIQFNEFVTLLCLCYILTKPSTSTGTPSRAGSPQLEAIFDTMIEAFMFMDKNKDGKLNKKDMIKALDDSPWEKSPAHVTRTRFKEMDKDKNGTVTFREFLFALTSWLGLDMDEEIPVISP